MNKSLVVPQLLLLFHCLTLCSCVYRVFIRQKDLHSYFKDTDHFDAVKGHHVDIIRHGKVFVSDGSLQLSLNSSDMTQTEGSGMVNEIIYPMGNSLPTIPNNVDVVTISWHANEMVSYFLEVDATPKDHFRMNYVNISLTGTIPFDKSAFELRLDCQPTSTGPGKLQVNLTIVPSSSGEPLTADFHLEKMCKGTVDSGSRNMMEPSVLSSSSLYLSISHYTTPIPSHLLTVSLISSDHLVTPYSTMELLGDEKTTFPPSPTSTLLTSSDAPASSSVTSSLEDMYFMPPNSVGPSSTFISRVFTTVVLSSFSPSPSSVLPLPASSPAVPDDVPVSSPAPDAPSSPSVAASSQVKGPSSLPLPSPSLPLPPTQISVQLAPDSPTEPPVESSAIIVGLDPTPTTQIDTEVKEESRLSQLLVIAFAPVVAILSLSICILLCCICLCAIKKKRNKEPKRVFSDDPLDLPVRYSREVPENELEESFSKSAGPPLTLWMALSWGTVSCLPAGVQSIIKHYTVDRRSLSILNTIAREDYGAVVRGQWNIDPVTGDVGVMMKMLTGFQKQYGHRDEIVHFVEEATLLRGRDHPNIHKVLKVSVEDNYIPVVVYPIVEYGNLHQFLTFCRSSPNESPLSGRYYKMLMSATTLPVTYQYKVNFALQIVSAMNFLSEEGIVHPDLALRNCLLDTGYNVKVADGALSQLFFPDFYMNVKGTVRPVRWAAIETLHHGQCTSLSNVWSYGVTVWEIMTLGEMPYSDVDNNRSVLSSLMLGERLPQPTDCPEPMYDVMMSCWEEQPTRRPSFNVLQSQVFEISGRYTPLPMLDSKHNVSTPSPIIPARGSGHVTPSSRNGPIQHNAMSSVHAMPQYVAVSDGGVSVDRKVSSTSLGLNRRMSRDSQQPDKLSITFSVLSGEILGEGSEGSSGEHSSEDEEDDEEREVDMIEPDLLDRFMPSLRKEQESGTSTEDSSRPVLTLTSPSASAGFEDTLKYNRLPPRSGQSPGPLSISTMTSRLSPCETHSISSSQYGPSTVRSDETPVPGVSSPSPDLTSKTSTIGDETLSTASNPLLTSTYHNIHSTPLASGSTGALSKTSTLDSMSTVSGIGTPDHSHTRNLVYSPHLNGSQFNRSERVTNHDTTLTNGHTPGKMNSDITQTVQSPSLLANLSNHGDNATTLDSKDSPSNGIVLRDRGVDDKLTPRDSRTSRTSFGLGLGDLSSDLLSAFDNWKS